VGASNRSSSGASRPRSGDLSDAPVTPFDIDVGDLSSDFTDSDDDIISPRTRDKRLKDRLAARRASIRLNTMNCILPHFAIRWGTLFSKVIPIVNGWRVARWESVSGIRWTAERAREAAKLEKEQDAFLAMQGSDDEASEDESDDDAGTGGRKIGDSQGNHAEPEAASAAHESGQERTQGERPENHSVESASLLDSVGVNEVEAGSHL